MLVPLNNFGKFGVVADTMNQALPIGTFTDARNMRFSGMEVEKMLEPLVTAPLDGISGDPVWMQDWADGLSTYVVVATQTDLYFLRRADADDVGTWVVAGSGYSVDGVFDSFSWGDTCIFNNGVDAPQIFNPNTLLFEDLPNWGMISTGEDISEGAEPSRDVNASCRILKPYGNFLVACGVTENGQWQPNTVWWSDSNQLGGILYPYRGWWTAIMGLREPRNGIR